MRSPRPERRSPGRSGRAGRAAVPRTSIRGGSRARSSRSTGAGGGTRSPVKKSSIRAERNVVDIEQAGPSRSLVGRGPAQVAQQLLPGPAPPGQDRNGSSSNASASRYRAAEECLHGQPQSGETTRAQPEPTSSDGRPCPETSRHVQLWCPRGVTPRNPKHHHPDRRPTVRVCCLAVYPSCLSTCAVGSGPRGDPAQPHMDTPPHRRRPPHPNRRLGAMQLTEH